MNVSNLKIERVKRKLSQQELSKALNISQCYLSQLENLNEKPGEELQAKFEHFFNIPIGTLLKTIDKEEG